MSALFPVVPLAPGVPNVLRNLAGSLPPTAAVLVQDAISAFGLVAPQWYLAFNGGIILRPDSVVGIDYKKEFAVAMYPVEQGQFESYNKVRLPYFLRVVMTKGGAVSDRAGFLKTLEEAAKTLQILDFVTPECTYFSCTVQQVSYRRTSTNGVELLTVEVSLQEIRVTASSVTSNTATPQGASQVNGGPVQGLSLPLSSASAISAGFGAGGVQ